MTLFYAVMEVIFVVGVIWGSYMLKGPPGKTMNPKKVARYRYATRFGFFWAILVFVRLVTHTYR